MGVERAPSVGPCAGGLMRGRGGREVNAAGVGLLSALHGPAHLPRHARARASPSDISCCREPISRGGAALRGVGVGRAVMQLRFQQ